MKKFLILLLIAGLFTACTPQEPSAESTHNPTIKPNSTEAPVTDGKAYFDPAAVAENEKIGIFTVRKVLRDESGALNAVLMDGTMTISGEFYYAQMPENYDGSYYADENGKTDAARQVALFKCDQTSRDVLPKAEAMDELTIVIALKEGFTFNSEYGKAEITIRGFNYYTAPTVYKYYSQEAEILTQTPIDASSFIQ